MLRFFAAGLLLGLGSTACVGHYDVPERTYVHVPPDFAASDPPGARLFAPPGTTCRSSEAGAKAARCPAVLAPGTWHLGMDGGGTELAVPHAPIDVHVTPPTPFNRGMLAVQASATAVLLAGGFGILIGAAVQDEHKSSTPTSNTLLGGGAILMGTGVLAMTVSSLLAALVGTGTVRVAPRSGR